MKINRWLNKNLKNCMQCRLLWPALAIFLLSVMVLHLFPYLMLSTEAGVVWCNPIMRDEKFTIKYTHSVNKSPVEDSIKWNGDKLVICESLYQSYGAGIPNEPESGQTFAWTKEGLLLSNINLERDSINLFVGTVADHYLIYRNQNYQIKKLTAEQTLLNISVRRLSLFGMLFNNKKGSGMNSG